MAKFISEWSDESSATSTTSSRFAGFLKLWQRWRPGSYFLVFVVNGTATALLWPRFWVEAGGDDMPCWDAAVFLVVLMFASLGAGCAAAFLSKRIGASVHAKLACGYAVINWFQSIFASMSVPRVECTYGFASLSTLRWFPVLACCRLALYFFCVIWMQMLIISRLDVLEQASRQNYRSSCIRTLVRVQVCNATAATLGLGFVTLIDSVPEVLFVSLLLAPLCFCVNLAACVLAICSLMQTFLQMHRVLHLVDHASIAPTASSSLRRARRFALLQATGVCLSLVLTILVFPVAYLGWTPIWMKRMTRMITDRRQTLLLVIVLVQAADVIGNAACVLLLSGSHRLPAGQQSRTRQISCRTFHAQPKTVPPKQLES